MKTFRKVHCFFEQSGTFKRTFIRHGIPAFDYDLDDQFKQVDYTVDLFHEIFIADDNIRRIIDASAHDRVPELRNSVFDHISSDDLIIAFFPCTYFSDMNDLLFQLHNQNTIYRGISIQSLLGLQDRLYQRCKYHTILLKLLQVCKYYNIPLIIENPRSNYLRHNFVKPSIYDHDRSIHGDFFQKPTYYWFFNIEVASPLAVNTKYIKQPLELKKQNGIVRSLISPDYAENFVSNCILGTSDSYMSDPQLTLNINEPIVEPSDDLPF